MPVINIYTDGSSRGNPGPGGYGVVLKCGTHYKELSAGYKHTTNNRMELMAVIVGLEALKKEGCEVHVYSDSSYVVKAIEEGWLKKWLVKGLHKQKNTDLWTRYIKVSAKHNVKFHWIKGHAGHPDNEKCDRLAVAAALDAEHHLIDEGMTADKPANDLFVQE
jgi:Ribonuclease HI